MAILASVRLVFVFVLVIILPERQTKILQEHMDIDKV